MQVVYQVKQSSWFPINFHFEHVVRRLAIIICPHGISSETAHPPRLAVIFYFRQNMLSQVWLCIRM